MRTLRKMLMAGLLAGATLSGWAGQMLTVRLVEASQSTAASSAALADVSAILSRNLPYASFTLQGTQAMALPANQTVGLGGYAVTCSGPSGELQVSVKRGSRVLISTILRLQGGVPVIVGGFPSANGKQIFVFSTR
jgi:hypothetical protein